MTAEPRLLTDIYSQLSEFFKEPTEEFADDIASGRVLRFFKNAFSLLNIDSSLFLGLKIPGDVFKTVSDEYRKLFLGPIPPYIVPVESVYKRWSLSSECTLGIAGERGYLMGDPALDMIRRYQESGVVVPDLYASMPDHIALELEYMAYLCRNAPEEEQREFRANHFDWIIDLADEVAGYDGTGFYSTAVVMADLINRSV